MTFTEIEELLQALGEQLDAVSTEPIELVVCGGTAMNLLGFLRRHTKDVDVVAVLFAHPDGEEPVYSSARPLPPLVLEARDRVARDFGVSPDWLNDGPASLMDFGLPKGFQARLVARRFGTQLTVQLLGRYDLICLKLEALADSDIASRHYQDLLALAPTHDELRSACDWIMLHNEPAGFIGSLKGALEALGASDVASAFN
jgi:hypothetical protein